MAKFWTVYLGFLSIIICAVFRGFLLSCLWGWFVSPSLGVLQLSIISAIGISLFWNSLNGLDEKDTKAALEVLRDEQKDEVLPGQLFWGKVGLSLVNNGSTLILGWLVSFLM